MVGTALFQRAQCETWERAGWLAPGACSAAAQQPRKDWGWIGQRPDEVSFDWKRDLLPRADLVVAQCGPHMHKPKDFERQPAR